MHCGVVWRWHGTECHCPSRTSYRYRNPSSIRVEVAVEVAVPFVVSGLLIPSERPCSSNRPPITKKVDADSANAVWKHRGGGTFDVGERRNSRHVDVAASKCHRSDRNLVPRNPPNMSRPWVPGTRVRECPRRQHGVVSECTAFHFTPESPKPRKNESPSSVCCHRPPKKNTPPSTDAAVWSPRGANGARSLNGVQLFRPMSYMCTSLKTFRDGTLPLSPNASNNEPLELLPC